MYCTSPGQEFIAPLIESTKELKAERDNLKAQLEDEHATRKTIDTMSREIEEMKARTGYGKARDDDRRAAMVVALAVGLCAVLEIAGMVRRRRAASRRTESSQPESEKIL